VELDPTKKGGITTLIEKGESGKKKKKRKNNPAGKLRKRQFVLKEQNGWES